MNTKNTFQNGRLLSTGCSGNNKTIEWHNKNATEAVLFLTLILASIEPNIDDLSIE